MIRCPEGETAFRWAGDIGRAPRRALQARTAHGMGGWRMADGLQGGAKLFQRRPFLISGPLPRPGTDNPRVWPSLEDSC
jgi:hypothetical protein